MSFDFSALYAQYLASDDHKRITLTPDELSSQMVDEIIYNYDQGKPYLFTASFTLDEALFLRDHLPA